jgi:hypothetical protein
MQNKWRIGYACVWALLALVWLAFPVAAQLPVPRRVAPNVSRLSQASDQKPAAVLVYNFYSSDAANPGQTDTLLTMTNTHAEESVTVHVFFIIGSVGAAGDYFVSLAANQSASFLASTADPGATGYVIAIAVDKTTGWPIGLNSLVGSASVKLASGHAGTLSAIGFSAHFSGALPGYAEEATAATLAFDGLVYDAVPRRLLLDNVPSAADGYATRLIVNSFNGALFTPLPPIGNYFGLYYDETGRAYSFAGRAAAQLNQVLSDEFPRSSPLFSAAIPAGKRTNLNLGVFREGFGMLGAVFYYHPNGATQLGMFSGGAANLHSLETTSTYLVKPVFAPTV